MAYSESVGQSQWWLYSRCPYSLALVELVLKYSVIPPFDAQFIFNGCLDPFGTDDDEDAVFLFVRWDPTCSSCKPPPTQH
jgi:hypothetical protein